MTIMRTCCILFRNETIFQYYLGQEREVEPVRGRPVPLSPDDRQGALQGLGGAPTLGRDVQHLLGEVNQFIYPGVHF